MKAMLLLCCCFSKTGLETISYRGALLNTLLHAISYRGALLNTLLHATCSQVNVFLPVYKIEITAVGDPPY
jgi:hypothetical protein